MQNNSFNNKMLTPHFSLLEMTESRTAKKHGIGNVPSEIEVENLRRLCQCTLEPLREALQLPVVITSGYRCKALNDLISHHSNRSQHMAGQAADFHVGKGSRDLLIKAFRQIILDDHIDFDQLILYPSFIHVSYVSHERNRRKLTRAFGDGKYQALARAGALLLR